MFRRQLASLSFPLDSDRPSQAELEREITDLRRLLETRAVIEQAKGLLMANYGITADEAFERLRRLSMDRNVKVRALSAQLVAAAAQPSAGPHSRFHEVLSLPRR